MTEMITTKSKITELSEPLIQLRHINGTSVYIEDPEGVCIEVKTTADGARIIFTKDEKGRSIAIEERVNGVKLYHISKDCTGLPSTHEIRSDKTEVIYFYNAEGTLQHFVELKLNGDRISTVIGKDRSVYSIEQRQIGGIGFRCWITRNGILQEGCVWLSPGGEVSTYGDKEIINDLIRKFSRFLDGVNV